jgi:hypothetical protein
MEGQLIGRYLKDNPQCSHGLYLVGWYNCDQWDDQDYRKKRSPTLSIDEARERFEEQAKMPSIEEGGYGGYQNYRHLTTLAHEALIWSRVGQQ